MKHNAYTTQPVRVFRQWGEPPLLPVWDLPNDHPVMVVWSPTHRSYICSITTAEYRYDAYISPNQFRLDPTLSDDGPSYYLDQAAAGSRAATARKK